MNTAAVSVRRYAMELVSRRVAMLPGATIMSCDRGEIVALVGGRRVVLAVRGARERERTMRAWYAGRSYLYTYAQCAWGYIEPPRGADVVVLVGRRLFPRKPIAWVVPAAAYQARGAFCSCTLEKMGAGVDQQQRHRRRHSHNKQQWLDDYRERWDLVSLRAKDVAA